MEINGKKIMEQFEYYYEQNNVNKMMKAKWRIVQKGKREYSN